MFKSIFMAVAFFVINSLAQEVSNATLVEPVYKSESQRYAVFSFTKNLKNTRWLIQDGRKFYYDLNGNLNLTDSGECFIFRDKKISIPLYCLEEEGQYVLQITNIFEDTNIYTVFQGPDSLRWRTNYEGNDLYELPDDKEEAIIIPLGYDLMIEPSDLPSSLISGSKVELKAFVKSESAGFRIWLDKYLGSNVGTEMSPKVEIDLFGTNPSKIELKLRERC
ncbi:hypothetical protein KAR48_18530 [bacterium]|nr:hypothetical protein [bacterium]